MSLYGHDMWAVVLEATPDPAVVIAPHLREAIAATGLPWRVRDTATGIELVLVPPGTYQRGCSPSDQCACFVWESPRHQVTLTSPFYIGRYPVTQAQWQARTGSNPSRHQNPSAEVPPEQVPSRPVETVSWNSVQDFLAGTGLRLPTDAEWEFAYRAGTTTAFHSMPGHPSGTNDDSLVGHIAWFAGNSAGQTRPVGQKAGNGFGVHDLSGNVFEWVNDWTGTYTADALTDPQGPPRGPGRLIRGGAWYADTRGLRASCWTGGNKPAQANTCVGFRVARTP